MDRIVDPKDPKVGSATLAGLKVGGTKKVDDKTVEITLESPNVLFDEALAERSCKIVPVGFDPKTPIGSGPFKMTEMKPGEQFKWAAFADYWDTPPYVDTLTMIEFADDTARINALQSGQIQAMSQLPKSQAKVIEATEGLALLNAETGAWRPFTMRIDAKPFDDVRVRQAFRLIVDRQQMIDQAYSGLGVAGQRHVRPLRRRHAGPRAARAGHRAGQVAAQAGRLRQQPHGRARHLRPRRSAATRSRRRRCSRSRPRRPASPSTSRRPTRPRSTARTTSPGRSRRTSGPRAASCSRPARARWPTAPYNETHWKNAEWASLVDQAWKTVDDDERAELITQAQQIEFDTGGYIIWSWRNQVDAYSKTTTGYKLDKLGGPIGRMYFKDVYFVRADREVRQRPRARGSGPAPAARSRRRAPPRRSADRSADRGDRVTPLPCSSRARGSHHDQ